MDIKCIRLVRFYYQAAVPIDGHILQFPWQFRPSDSCRHCPHQARFLPARQQIIQIDEHDEEGPAADDGNP